MSASGKSSRATALDNGANIGRHAGSGRGLPKPRLDNGIAFSSRHPVLIAPGEATGVTVTQYRRRSGIEPLLRGGGVCRVNGQSLIEDLPAARVSQASWSRWGQGASGLTWSGVSGDTPPPIIDARRHQLRQHPGAQVGGAWTLIPGPNTRRATAMVHNRSSRSGSGAEAILVPGLAGNSG